MLIQVSEPTSAAELRALYRTTRRHFAAASRPARGPLPAAAPPTRIPRTPAPQPPARFSGRATLRIVARHFGLTPAALAGATRLHRCVVARWIVMHICVRAGGYTAARAGQLVGRDHTTTLYGLREFAAMLANDAALADEVTRLTRQCVPDAPRTTVGEGGA